MLNGSFALLLTGLALVTLEELEAEPAEPHQDCDQAAVIIAVIVVLVAKNRKFATIPRGLWGLIGGLTIANAGVAVLWQ